MENTIYDLKLHDQMTVNNGINLITVLRVPGGWIYGVGERGIFVPYCEPKYSAIGMDFSGNELTEDNLGSGQAIIYKGNEYKTGHRRGGLVELYKDKFLGDTVQIRDIRLVRP